MDGVPQDYPEPVEEFGTMGAMAMSLLQGCVYREELRFGRQNNVS